MTAPRVPGFPPDPSATLTSVQPDSGPPGVTVTLTGTGFGPGSVVWFGDSPALRVEIVSTSLIHCVVPPRRAGACHVSVTSDAGVASKVNSFT